MKAWQMLFIFLSLLIAVPLSYSENPGLRIELAADYFSAANFGKISVSPKIINTGFEDQAIQFFLCSYDDSWVVDNPSVSIDARTCKNNPLHKIVLKPGEFYENQLYPLTVVIGVPAEEILQESVTFRLGFKSDVLNREDKSRAVIWSDPITVKVTER